MLKFALAALLGAMSSSVVLANEAESEWFGLGGGYGGGQGG